MSKVSERIEQIKTEQIGQTGKKVLLVEGTDDKDAYQIFLNKKFPGWEQTWTVAHMGNKKSVLSGLAQEPDWVGLVDRDEWTPKEQVSYKSQYQKLQILPRFCLESYLVNPAELWQAFPAKQQAKVAGGEEAFRATLLESLNAWIRHAALWHGVRPLWRQLRDAGFPDDVTMFPPVTDDDELRKFFGKWHNLLDAEKLLERVHALEAQLSRANVDEVCQNWLHAKEFYTRVVHETLNRLLGVKSVKERRLAIFRTRPVPSDLDGVWQAMGLNP